MAFWRNSNGTFWTLNGKCLIGQNMTQTAPISTGGRFTLPGGDALIIEPEGAEGWYEGGPALVFHLESGEPCAGIYYSKNNNHIYSSIFNSLEFDIPYENGDVLRVYPGELYTNDRYDEAFYRYHCEVEPVTLEVVDGNWVERKTDPYHQKITNSFGTFDIYWNALVCNHELGFYVIPDSGSQILIFYYSEADGWINLHSNFNWIGCNLTEYDGITVFEADYYDYDFSDCPNSEAMYDKLMKNEVPVLDIYYDGSKWIEC